MPRVNFVLTEPQIKNLNQISETTGLSVSEIIRRAVDDWIEKYEEKQSAKRERDALKKSKRKGGA